MKKNQTRVNYLTPIIGPFLKNMGLHIYFSNEG